MFRGKDKRYRITVRCSGHEQVPLTIHVTRDLQANAIDAAKRRLRLVRNTKPDNATYDTWDLYELVPPTFDGKLVAHGTWAEIKSTMDGRTDPGQRSSVRVVRGYAGPFGAGPQTRG